MDMILLRFSDGDNDELYVDGQHVESFQDLTQFLEEKRTLYIQSFRVLWIEPTQVDTPFEDAWWHLVCDTWEETLNHIGEFPFLIAVEDREEWIPNE